MFRLTRYLDYLAGPADRPAAAARSRATGPVVIWNLTRRCNLTCRHCYSTSADRDFAGELTTAEALQVMADLRAFGVPVLILSGGEPLLRGDLFTLSAQARALGFYVALSTNGTLIDRHNIDAIADAGYDYVGISLDGIGATHDRFRRQAGAYDAALRAVDLCKQRGIKVGLRFTLTRHNAADLPQLLALMREHEVDKFFLSHLNYGGRGNVNRRDDAAHRLTRQALETLIETAWHDVRTGARREYVTGNNDADGIYLLHWAARHRPDHVAGLRTRLAAWGGNASGEQIANIDNLGHVHPDTFWWHHSLGNVRQQPFSAIWSDQADPLLRQLRRRPRPLRGRCGACSERAICNGSSRIRAFQASQDYWAEDPGCYLTDAEIGLLPVGVDDGALAAGGGR
jgi:heme d1 biosynthesis radical SAM protein NirJ